MSTYRDFEKPRARLSNVSLNLGPSGPTRVAEDPDPNFKPRPVGFTAHLREPEDEPEREPKLWEGDDA